MKKGLQFDICLIHLFMDRISLLCMFYLLDIFVFLMMQVLLCALT